MKTSSKWKKRLSGLMGLGVLTATLLTSVPLSTEAAAIESGKTYKLQVKSSGMFLQPNGSGAHATLKQQPGQNNEGQEWIITKVNGDNNNFNNVYNYNDVYNIRNKKTGMYIDVPKSSTSIREQLIQYPYNGGFRNQQWKLIDLGNGYYNIQNFGNGLNLDVWGSTRQTLPIFQKLKPVIQFTPNNGENQQFKLIEQ